ncbi:peptidyl-prolyl cis-trans isomerase FKBP43 isoform X1 [Vigna angularis]|uniref:peptidyl-prolyl cis-trans isomerase FKBP43 isoform X1 n=1 Tax=Phaseolus angularis TaxID=3914 RepID=UPI00080A3E0D|nr:peptidyl-prolyl cis-trans isomerase FKBP43 isoform X1 [Vigna angularis]
MAFWGVEVKPGKPFTHKYEDSKGRLHISMATLGLGTATAKSTLQCNVGNRSPVYLCSLYPGNAESLQLNLELEEVDQVLFSVIGPRSIHLCGYYLATARNANLIDDSESYGEDIADTETERSDYSDEDGYDDSFIDDDIVPEASSPSLISKEEEASHDNGPKIRKGSLRRLRKMYQSVESDDDGCGGEKIIVNDRIHDQVQETDNEDSLPISSIYKNKASGRVLDKEMDVSVVRGAGDASNKNEEDGGNNIFETNLEAGHVLVDSQTYSREAVPSKHLVDPCTSLDVGDVKSPKKKKKKKEKEAKSSCNGRSIKLDNVINELKMEEMTQVIVAGGKQEQHVDDKETETTDKMLPSSQVDHGLGEKPKKKKKERSKEGMVSIATDGYHNSLVNLPLRNEQHSVNDRDVKISGNAAEMDPKKNRAKRKKKEQVNKSDYGYNEEIFQEDNKANRDAAGSQNAIHNFFEEKEQHQKLTNEKMVDNGAYDLPDGNQSENRKAKKRKKMSKSQGNGEVVNSNITVYVERSGETEMMEEDRSKGEDAKHSNVRTLKNGLVIQEQEKGKKDGKIAASGKKISIYYTGKLKENGAVFESNAGQTPFKFRLGKGEVIEGWDVGLEGMQVGEKRRLVIPPTLTSESDGHSDKIPPNSWLIYDIELIKVH